MARLAKLIDTYARNMTLTGEAYLKYKNSGKGYEEQLDYNSALYRLRVVAYALHDLGIMVETFEKFQEKNQE